MSNYRVTATECRELLRGARTIQVLQDYVRPGLPTFTPPVLPVRVMTIQVIFDFEPHTDDPHAFEIKEEGE